VSDSDSISRRLLGLWFKLLVQAAAGLAALLLVAAALWIWFAQERLLFHPAALPAATVLSVDADTKEVAVEVPGARLSALHLHLPKPKGLVFFLHGNAGNLQSWFVNTALYRAANFDLFMLDYRGYGKSSGTIQSEAQLRDDVRAAWAQVAPLYAGKKIVVYGRSLGSGLAAGLVAELAASPGARQPDLTVLVSPYTSIAALTADYYPWVPQALLRYPLRTDEVIAKIRGPLLLFHGDKDELIAPRHSETLKALAPQAQLIYVVGAAHNDVQKFPAYRDAFVAALNAL
jgi:uncharacterized protein